MSFDSSFLKAPRRPCRLQTGALEEIKTRGRMRIYELIFICKPDLPEEEIDAQVAAVQETIESGGGTVAKVDKWGKKKLAYKVQKFTQGYYVLVEYSMEDNLGIPKEIERRLGVAEPVIKFLTVRIDEELKRAAKLRLKREKRLARKPAPAPRPAAPKPEAPVAPGAPATPSPAAPVAEDAAPATEAVAEPATEPAAEPVAEPAAEPVADVAAPVEESAAPAAESTDGEKSES
jgi:small subunit ribosomal protein S6